MRSPIPRALESHFVDFGNHQTCETAEKWYHEEPAGAACSGPKKSYCTRNVNVTL